MRKCFVLCHLEKTKTFLCYCGGRNILKTYPAVPPAACHYPLTPPSPHPCHTCSQPEPPEHYPTNTFLSGSTCAETTSMHQRLPKMDNLKLFKAFLCHLFCRRRAWGRTEWRTCGRVMNAYITLITASCHTWISCGRAGKLGQLLLMSWIHTWSNHQSVILHIFCICPCFLSACSKFWLWKLVFYCHCTDLKRSVQEQVIWGDCWQIQQSIASKYALMTFLLKCYTCTHLILARTSYEFCNLGIILCIYI